MLSCTERSTNPSTHHRQTIAVALKAKAASAQSCVEPNASVVVTTATQIVKKTRRLATVGRSLVCSRVGEIPFLIIVFNGGLYSNSRLVGDQYQCYGSKESTSRRSNPMRIHWKAHHVSLTLKTTRL